MEQKSGFEATEEEIMSEEVVVDRKSGFEAGRRHLVVPEDELELYSSGEESYDQWTVETYRVYEVTKNVEADVTLTRTGQLAAASSSSFSSSSSSAAAAAAAAAGVVDTSHGVYTHVCLRISIDFVQSTNPLAHDAASYKRPLFSDSVSVAVCICCLSAARLLL